MKILFDNVNVASNSGPNGFAKKLETQLSKRHDITYEHQHDVDVQLAFIEQRYSSAPIVQRLDGIYFNTRFDYEMQNKSIKKTHDAAEAIIVQSEFDRKLISEMFGAHPNTHVIHNGAPDWKTSYGRRKASIAPDGDVWLSASDWRPHKRLNDCIIYFKKHSSKDDIMLVAGRGTDQQHVNSISDTDRVFYIGDLSYSNLINWMLAAKYFVHLAYLDHCPNVVVDARNCGCHIICSSSGGTEEIAGLDSTVIVEDAWKFEPIDLYDPPRMDFSRKRAGMYNNSCDIDSCAQAYETVLEAACLSI